MNEPVGSTRAPVGPGRAVGPNRSDKRPRYPVGRRADRESPCGGCMALATFELADQTVGDLQNKKYVPLADLYIEGSCTAVFPVTGTGPTTARESVASANTGMKDERNCIVVCLFSGCRPILYTLFYGLYPCEEDRPGSRQARGTIR